ncbi:probable L-type lectin-domain containing receptor kinase S.5 [Phalaenopsis equestris]|uniref:probable L-type lectin-domain containing receptor kinase S.5 n=1 Tax=Phalaenopsis equestris TaxID=78828 RepID=UPI0009E2731A|nr:probable L-type lectin-domain containing receptor kinase S.5 [Phalaenopsis equestris]
MRLFSVNLLILLSLSNSRLFASSSPSNNLSFSFSSFDRSNHNNFNFSNDAGVSQGALQVTPDTFNDLSYLLTRSGRILLSRSFRLWESNRTASFNTSFSINIYRPSNATLPGEGLAFLIAPDAHGPPPGSYGGFLGLTNSTTDGRSSNRIVAVEFDTVKQRYDIDDNHVGLDINGVDSEISASLTPFGIQIAPVGAVNNTVWIDYDGIGGGIMVFMTRQGNPKPETPVLAGKVNLSDYVNQYSYFGFAASTGAVNYELNCVLDWNLTVENLEEEKNDNKGEGTGWKVSAGIAAGVFVLAVAAGIVTALWYSKRRRQRKNKATVDPSMLAGALKSLPGMPREFEYKELRKATNDFDERRKLGQGGFGIVYKGVIAGEGTEVAVKKFSREDNMNSQDDFLKELTVINRLRHKHLVRLLGWCHENGLLLLVYDYMPKGSLDQHLYGGATSDHFLLPWNRRIQVAADVASALHYLHHEYDECVVHRDLKSSNVMLDSTFHARLGDFGLARVLDTDKTSYAELDAAGVPGTLGYIAPECFHTGKATRESDLFAFGALLLELVCGRRPRSTDLPSFHFLVDWVWTLHRDGRILEAVDEKLEGDFLADEARRMLLLGLACSHPVPGERPKSAAIMQILAGLMPSPEVPAFRPAFMWPAAEPGDGGGGLTSMSSLMISSSLYASSSSNY